MLLTANSSYIWSVSQRGQKCAIGDLNISPTTVVVSHDVLIGRCSNYLDIHNRTLLYVLTFMLFNTDMVEPNYIFCAINYFQELKFDMGILSPLIFLTFFDLYISSYHLLYTVHSTLHYHLPTSPYTNYFTSMVNVTSACRFYCCHFTRFTSTMSYEFVIT